MTLQEAFEKECNKQKNSNILITNEMINTFNWLNESLVSLPFKDCGVEIMLISKRLKITLSFNRDKLLMITKSYEINQIEVFAERILYSLFFEKNHQISDMVNLKQFVKSFTNYIQS